MNKNLVGLRVRVYRNLHKDCLSVQHKGRVIAHVDSVLLKRATFTVQPAGRKKVIETRQKNVHAFISGTVLGVNLPISQEDEIFCAVTYNPYKYDRWVNAEYPHTGLEFVELVHVATKKVTVLFADY